MYSMKNRETFPVGTRVKPAYAKISKMVGTVIGHETDRGREDRMVIQWDNQMYPQSGYMPSEVRPLREEEND